MNTVLKIDFYQVIINLQSIVHVSEPSMDAKYITY